MENVKIYQANQIGGCVTVISAEHEGKIHRIMIDFGSSLEGSDNEKDFDYPWEEEPVDAVFFTHYHGDHVGRLMEVPNDVPMYMGPVARQAMINIQDALGHSRLPDAELHLEELRVLKDDSRIREFNWNGRYYDTVVDIPGFRVEPYMIDHSAYDAYMFLIEAEDRSRDTGKYVVLHTGDFRGHGRRGSKMLTLIKGPVKRFGKRRVDALVIEGTMMSRPTENVLSEYEMQLEAAEYLSEHKYAFLICSSTNVDSLASFYQGAQMASYPYGRRMYVYSRYFEKQLELYTKTAGSFSEVYRFEDVHRLERTQTFSHEKWPEPKTQQELMEKYGFLATIKPDESCEKYIDPFVEAYRSKRIDQMPVIIYSMWEGYINPKHKAAKPAWIDFLEKQRSKGLEVKPLHTSGHATVGMLVQVINAVDPQDKLYPMHTEKADEFENLPIKDEIKKRI